MKNLCLSLLLCFSFSLLCSQTYFYLDEVTVAPTNPTTLDSIKVKIEGNKATPCVTLESLEFSQQGPNFQFVFNWFDPSLACVQVLEPWDTILLLPPQNEGINCVQVINVSPGSSDTTDVCFDVTMVNNDDEVNFANDFLLYPNPAKGHVNWKLFNNTGQERLFCVFDLLGREVVHFKSNANSGSINVRNWGSGWYFLTGQLDGVRHQVSRFEVK